MSAYDAINIGIKSTVAEPRASHQVRQPRQRRDGGGVPFGGRSRLSTGLSGILTAVGRRLGLIERHTPPVDFGRVPDFQHLQNEVLRLSRERAKVSSENQLLAEIIGHDGPTAASRLLRRLIPRSAEAGAAFFELVSDRPVPLAARGLPLDISCLTEQCIQQLKRDAIVVTRIPGMPTTKPEARSGFRDQHELPAGSQPTEPESDCDLFLVPIKHEEQVIGILATTCLWPFGIRPQEQVDILGRLGQTILRRFLHERTFCQHQRDLKLTKEMLRLKSKTDKVSERPLESLGELLAGLCEAIQMDRAALYLVSRREEDIAEPVVHAGTSFPLTVGLEWQRHEVRLASVTASAITPQRFDSQRLASLGIATLWGQAIVCPLQSTGQRLGTLILSRRNPDQLVDLEQKLVDFSSELLVQALQSIHRDAAIRRQARHDGLTDLANRRTFDTLLAGEIDRVRLGLSDECSLLLADLDRFKSINDEHGHQAGDEVLKSVAQLLRERVGRTRIGERSLLARYGGEELAVLLPGVGIAGALRVAEEIRASIERMPISFGNKRLKVTISIGAASCPSHGLRSADLISAADSALYRAKTQGRNRVCQPQGSAGE